MTVIVIVCTWNLNYLFNQFIYLFAIGLSLSWWSYVTVFMNF